MSGASPVGTTACQAGPLLRRLAPPNSLVPSMNQMAASPLLFCQRMSALPSPLKSPAATACKVGPLSRRLAPPASATPFMNQIAGRPLLCCQNTVSIWHGDADGRVVPRNRQELVEQWTAVHGITARH